MVALNASSGDLAGSMYPVLSGLFSPLQESEI